MFKLYSDNIVLKDRVIKGYIVIEDHIIKDVVENQIPEGDYLDYTGKFVMPGMINLQCESLIGVFEQSECMVLPDETLFLKVERDLALAGITTVFHDLAIDRFTRKSDIDQLAETLVYVKCYRDREFLIDHKTNLKIRLGQVYSSENLRNLIISDVIDIITYIGDITEEQEVYQDEYQKQYLMESLTISEEEAALVIERIKQDKIESAAEELVHRLSYCISNNVAVATTKYRVVSKIEENYDTAINIISTPRSQNAWEYIKEKNKYVVVDLENLENDDCKDAFLSYNQKSNKGIVTAKLNPEALLEYIFDVAETIGIVDAVGLVTWNPAAALNLESTTGDLAIGKEADVIVVDANGSVPITILSVSDGNPIFKMDYNPGKKQN